MHESEVIAIAIDGSGSMAGSEWNKAVRSAKELIDYIQKHHTDCRKIRIIIVVFNDKANVV